VSNFCVVSLITEGEASAVKRYFEGLVVHFQSPHPNDSATLKTWLNTQSIRVLFSKW